eukprot:CAMPEP_0201116134 /NCGR_PEP_ID=MMETSP0850-20130426/500_1 /ASSEMBLY_ACC=CAM_ASM_000622 /TAXON_ID=183588 /ORGANISM="Pseudo-nitzschia fraudulenta, Strain WWA7" /LENGTH=288 /DNA_ID=CAMNT_0047380139 /DNA_START=32 /DNA_END=898 /DNA_ORIENTATION=+
MKNYPAKALSLVALVSSLTMQASVVVRTTNAFVVSPSATTAATTSSISAFYSRNRAAKGVKTTPAATQLFMSSASTGESEVEKLLRMARELRAQAEESEKEVHEKQADRKADKEARLGGLLNHLFYDGTDGKDIGTATGSTTTAINHRSVVVERLRSKKPSVDTLEKLVDWLDDRRDQALGYEHVESKGGNTFASVKGEKDEAEAERLFALTELLLDALEVTDGENRKDDGHLGGGHNASDLRRRLKEKRRQRDEQFLERQKSFREAQTIKEGQSKYEFHDEFLDDRE